VSVPDLDPLTDQRSAWDADSSHGPASGVRRDGWRASPDESRDTLDPRGALLVCHWLEPQRKRGYAEAYLTLGQDHLVKGRLDEAYKALRRALEIKSSLVEAQPALGFTLLAQDRAEEASVVLAALWESGFDPASALNGLGLLDLMAERLQDARDRFHEAAERNPQRPEPRSNLAVCLAFQGRDEEARDLWNQLRTQYPHFAPAAVNLDRLDGGHAELVSAEPLQRQIAAILADGLVEVEADSGLIRLVRVVGTTQNPSEPEGHDDSSASQLIAALGYPSETRPDGSPAENANASATETAESEAETTDPDAWMEADLQVELGRALMLQERDEDARDAFRRALRLIPHHPDALQALHELETRSHAEPPSIASPPSPPSPALRITPFPPLEPSGLTADAPYDPEQEETGAGDTSFEPRLDLAWLNAPRAEPNGQVQPKPQGFDGPASGFGGPASGFGGPASGFGGPASGFGSTVGVAAEVDPATFLPLELPNDTHATPASEPSHPASALATRDAPPPVDNPVAPAVDAPVARSSFSEAATLIARAAGHDSDSDPKEKELQRPLEARYAVEAVPTSPPSNTATAPRKAATETARNETCSDELQPRTPLVGDSRWAAPAPSPLRELESESELKSSEPIPPPTAASVTDTAAEGERRADAVSIDFESPSNWEERLIETLQPSVSPSPPVVESESDSGPQDSEQAASPLQDEDDPSVKAVAAPSPVPPAGHEDEEVRAAVIRAFGAQAAALLTEEEPFQTAAERPPVSTVPLEDLVAGIDAAMAASDLQLASSASVAESHPSPQSGWSVAMVPTPRRDEAAATRVRHVVFTLGQTQFAVPMSSVLEIQRPPKVTPIPNVPDWVLGVTNLRGDVLSLVDLRCFLGMDPVDYDRAGRMMVVRSADQDLTTGLIVDRVNGLIAFSDQEVQRLRMGGESGTLSLDHDLFPFARGIVGRPSSESSSGPDQLIVVLDLESLLQSEEMRQFQPS